MKAILEPIYANLLLLSDPPGAEVNIGQHYKGKTGDTPLEIELPPGTHQLQVRMEGYHPWEEEISLEGDRIKPLKVTLKPFLATLHIKSTPSKANVYIASDDTPRGKTPLPLGTYKIRVKKKNYQPWNKEIHLEKSSMFPLSVALKPILATLQIESSPSGAHIYVDGKPRDKTPISLELPLGPHKVRVTMKGYHPQETLVELQKQRSPPVNIRLRPKKIVYLEVETKPSGSEVYIDNEHQGQTPITVEVPPKKHRLRLTKDPQQEWERSVDLSDLEEKTLFRLVIDLRSGKHDAHYKETWRGPESMRTRIYKD